MLPNKSVRRQRRLRSEKSGTKLKSIRDLLYDQSVIDKNYWSMLNAVFTTSINRQQLLLFTIGKPDMARL